MPQVYNRYHYNVPEGAVNIMRPSEWGNSYSHLAVPGTIKVETREEAVAEFEAYVERNPWFQERIKESLRGKDLVCCCKPKLCHGDVLLRIANEED